MTKFFGKNCLARGKIKLPGGTRFCTLTGVSIGVGIGGIVLIAVCIFLITTGNEERSHFQSENFVFKFFKTRWSSGIHSTRRDYSVENTTEKSRDALTVVLKSIMQLQLPLDRGPI